MEDAKELSTDEAFKGQENANVVENLTDASQNSAEHQQVDSAEIEQDLSKSQLIDMSQIELRSTETQQANAAQIELNKESEPSFAHLAEFAHSRIRGFTDAQAHHNPNPARTVKQVMEANACDRVVLFTLGAHTVFAEIVNTLWHQLTDLGVACIRSNEADFSDPTAFYVLYNCHNMPAPLPEGIHYAVFNYEQAGSGYMTYEHYLAKMSHATAVFDYSHYNKVRIEPLIMKPVLIVPYSYHRSLTVLEPDFSDTEPLDILFYGSMNPNRQAYCDLLTAAGFKVKFTFSYNLFGATLMEELKTAKIVLNLHYYAHPSVLELSRIVPLISNYKLVLSERSDDFAADERFAEMIEFVDMENIVEVCKKYLNSPTLRHRKIVQAFTTFQSEVLI